MDLEKKTLILQGLNLLLERLSDCLTSGMKANEETLIYFDWKSKFEFLEYYEKEIKKVRDTIEYVTKL